MNTLFKTSLFITSVIVLSVTFSGCWRQTQKPQTNIYNPTQKEVEKFEEHAEEEHGEWHVYVTSEQVAAYATGELSEQEINDIIHMRQEEKLARDIYRTLGETYPINQFKNIPLSEQKHTDAMELLLERYNIEDPIKDETIIWTYKDEKFITLFNELTQQWKNSLIDALRVWAMVEDINMAKLLEVIKNTDNKDIQFVYESVLAQSHNHMIAFVNWLRKEWSIYTPTYISQEYFDTITK